MSACPNFCNLPTLMFPTWRLKLREARAAYLGGRYDEAGSLLQQSDVRDFLPAKRLAGDVAAKFVVRAEGRIARGDTLGGWHDLVAAGRLGGQEEAVDRVRQQYIDGSLREVARYLAAGEPRPALKRLAGLEQKGLVCERVRIGRQIAELMIAADQAAARGQPSDAIKALERAGSLAAAFRAGDQDTMDISDHLNKRAEKSQRQVDELARLSGQLHAALASESWSEVLIAAEAILATAPEHSAARQAQKRAWRAVGMDQTRSAQRVPGGPVPLVYGPVERKPGLRSTRRSIRTFEDDTVSGLEQPRRDLLWIDAVGGYLICFDDQLVLGQPAPDRPIAVPILADLSRRHAVIRRDGGSYLIEPVQRTYLDGRQLTGPTLLADNQIIQLGDGVRLRFNKPHALSSTARLTIESGHRTQPRADAIVMMADSCVLGPGRHCHIRCRDWQHDVILFRRGEGLMARAGCELRVGDMPVEGPVEIVPGERVEGDEFSLCIEEV